MSLLKVPVFGAQPYGFKASDVSGCRVWLDAADVGTFYSVLPITGIPSGFSSYTSANEQRISVWEDKSIGGNDMIRPYDPTNFANNGGIYNNSPQVLAPDVYPTTLSVLSLDQGVVIEGSLSSNQPSYLEANLCNITYIRSIPSGSGSARGPRIGTGLSATTDVFVVVQPKYLTNSPGDVFSIGSRTGGGGGNYTTLSITSSGYWKINTPSGARDVTSSVPEVFNTFSNNNGPDPNYRIIHMSLSNTNYVLRRNSYTVGTGNYSWNPDVATLKYYIGKKYIVDNPGNFFNGKIGEIIVYNEIIPTEKRLIVESYLANKWNLVDLLPLDHPAHLKNIPIFLKGLSLADAPNGYTNRGSMRKIFVLGPEAPTINSGVISAGGLTFTVSWSPNGGSPDYYSVTIQRSTDNSTWTNVAYVFQYRTTSFVYTIGGVDNKYYQAIIQAKNSGGSASTISDSALNSVPAPPSPSIPTTTGTSNLRMSWTPVYPGGIPTSYTIYLYISTDSGSTFTQTDTYSNIAANNYTVIEKCVLLEQYKIKVTATNSIGTSAESVFSSTFTYNGAGS